MRTDTDAFRARNTAKQKRPRYSIAVSFDSANANVWWLTSHTDSATPPGASVIANVVEGIAGTSQTLTPDEGRADIGAISFNVVDRGGTVTSTLGAQLTLGRSTRRQRVQVYVGYEGLAWADYTLVQTQLVTDITWKDGAYQFGCMDVQRQLRKDIFDLAKTQINSTIDENATTVDVVSTAAFTMIAHGASYTDAPNLTVGYIKIEDEVIRYTGKTSTQFTGCTRGALNTRPARHEADLTVSADQRTPIDEYVYLELPAVKLMYALLTGTLYNQGGATLPATWHMGVDPAYVQLGDFTGKPDLYDPADDTKGFPVRFEDLRKQDGKAFLEKELALLLGTYMPIYASGALGLRKMASVLAGAAYTQLLDESNVKSYTELKHDFESLHNILQVSWNWEPLLQDFTRINILSDGNSATVHGKADPLKYEFRGLSGSIHSSTILSKRFDALRDRYSGPPLRMSVDVVPSLNALEIGDVVRVKLAKVRDFVANATLDRSFEIQNIKIDWVTGGMSLDLFASSQAAAAQSPSTNTTAITDAWYTSQGTNLTSVLTITGSNPGHVSANGAVAGSTDMNAAGSIFYYNGDLQIDNGVTVTLTGNVQLRIKGFLQNNGTINGKGGGIAGAVAITPPPASATNANAGTAGFIGATEAGGGYSSVKVPIGFSGGSFFLHQLNSTRGKIATGQYAVVPPIELRWNGSTLAGIPTEMRGTSGSSGMPFYPDPATGFTGAAGGAGGASGAGLCVVARGFALGASAKIDLSGGDGATGSFTDAQIPTAPNTIRYRAGSGAGGAPGALVVLLDGANQSATGISEQSFVALNGKTPILPTVINTASGYMATFADSQLTSFYTGSGDGSTFALPSMSGSRGASRVQFVPANTANTADPSPTELTPPTDLKLIARAYAVLGGGFQVRIEATWTSSGDPLVAGYDLQYKKSVDSAWISAPSVVGRTAASAVVASGIQPGIDYDVRLRSAGSLRQVSENWVSVLSFYAAPTMVSGLELDPNNRVSYDVFAGRDAVVIWRADGQQTSYDIGSEPYGAGSGAVDAYQKDFLVRVLVNGAVRREEILTGITTPTYTYTLEKNIFDGRGTPVRAFTIRTWRRDDQNQVSPISSSIDVSNPQISAPSGISVLSGPNTSTWSVAKPADTDYAGTLVFRSTSLGFTPSGTTAGAGNCVYDGTDVAGSFNGLAERTTYYYKFAHYDTFGKDSLNYSSEVASTTTFTTGGIEKVTSLPAAGTQGRVVYLTTDGKLYRDSGAAWVKTTDGADLIANTVTADRLNVANLAAISANLGSITAGSITLDTSGFIKGGQSGYNTGTGFFLGYSGAYKLSIGDPAGNFLTWDGAALSMNGKLSAQNIVLNGTSPITLVADTDGKTVGISGGSGLGNAHGGQAQFIGNGDTGTGQSGGVNIFGGQGTAGDASRGVIKIAPYNTSDGTATVGITMDQSSNTVVGDGSSSTTRTIKHFYIPTTGGAPTGVPASYAGRVALEYDTTNNKLYAYNGAWKGSAAFT